jgi:hypothetical protein
VRADGCSTVLFSNTLSLRAAVANTGNTYSGRLKAHLICGSVVISHRLGWETFETVLFEDGKTMVLTNDDWTGLAETWQKLEAEPVLAGSIAANSAKALDLLTGE